MTEHEKGKHSRSPLQDQTEIRRQQILDFFKQCQKQGRIAPTHREVALAIGYKESSFGTVHPLIEDLIGAGFLKRTANGARTIQLVEPQPADCYYDRSKHQGRSPFYPRQPKAPRTTKTTRANPSPEFRERLKLIK